MKNLLIALIIGLILFSSCQENLREEKILVTYEIITSEGSEWSGEFADANGDRILTFELARSQNPDGNAMFPSGWTYEFEPMTSPLELVIHGTVECPTCVHETQRERSEDLTANIYINGELVNTKQMPFADQLSPPKD